MDKGLFSVMLTLSVMLICMTLVCFTPSDSADVTDGPLCITAKEDGCKVKYWAPVGDMDMSIEKSYSGTDWEEWGVNEEVLLGYEEKLYVRNTKNTLGMSNLDYFNFSMVGRIAVSGNINSMINYADITPYCFTRMFENCHSLVDASELEFPATELQPYCYSSMFYASPQYGTSALEKAPKILPATILAEGCYSEMFAACVNLTEVPVLPATTLAAGCYLQMFYDCTSLTEAPVLPADNLADHCYGSMFEDCRSLRYAPVLPAATLVDGCYARMFDGCTSLTESPVLPADNLVFYCYAGMFNDCKNLKTVACYASDISAEKATEDWLYGCEIKEFHTPHPSIWAGKLPEGCTVHISYKITLDPKEGVVDISYLTTDEKGVLNEKLPYPVYSGHIFDGWYTESGSKVDESYAFRESTEIHAKWKDPITPVPTPVPVPETSADQNIFFIGGAFAVVIALFALAFAVVRMKK